MQHLPASEAVLEGASGGWRLRQLLGHADFYGRKGPGQIGPSTDPWPNGVLFSVLPIDGMRQQLLRDAGRVRVLLPSRLRYVFVLQD